jgi:hypothetical protein
MRVLVVKSAFKDYQKGDVIRDEAEMQEVLENHAIHVVASEHPEAPKE